MAERDSAGIGREWFESWNDRDFDRGAALVADGARIVETPTGETFTGPDGSRKESDKWATALPDGRVTVKSVVASKDAAAFECTVRGTNTGPFVSPMGEIPATGREVTLDFCTILQIENDKIAGGRHYYDVATMMIQLGLMEAPAGVTA